MFIKYLEKRDFLYDWFVVGGVLMGGMIICVLLVKYFYIVVGVCLMGFFVFLEYGKEIVRWVLEYNYILLKDYFDLILWVKSYDLLL